MILNTFRNGKYSSMQWLAIPPLLALSTTLASGTLAGLMMFSLLIILSFVFSSVRRLIPYQLRLPVIVLILSTVISLMDMGMQFYFYEVRESFGIYLPLIAVNSLIFAITEDFFFRHGLKESVPQALKTGSMFLILFILLSLIREIAGYGTLFRDAGMMNNVLGWTPVFRLPGGFTGISLLHGPSGALLVTGLLAALIRCIFRDIALTGQQTYIEPAKA